MSPRLQGGGAASGPGPVTGTGAVPGGGIDVPGAFGGAALAVVAATPPVANAGGGGRARNDQRPAKAFKVAGLGRHQDLRQEEEPVLHCQDKPKVQEEPKVLQEEPQVLLRAALPPLRP